MNTNKIYQQSKQTQLNAYMIDLRKLKAITSKTNKTVQVEMNNHFRWIGFMIDEINSILLDFQKNNGKTWPVIQLGIESALVTLQDSLKEAKAELKLETILCQGA